MCVPTGQVHKIIQSYKKKKKSCMEDGFYRLQPNWPELVPPWQINSYNICFLKSSSALPPTSAVCRQSHAALCVQSHISSVCHFEQNVFDSRRSHSTAELQQVAAWEDWPYHWGQSSYCPISQHTDNTCNNYYRSKTKSACSGFNKAAVASLLRNIEPLSAGPWLCIAQLILVVT